MNRFVKIVKQKVSKKFIGNLDIFNSIAELIDSNTTFCICGPPGVGKTYMVTMLLNDKEFIETTKFTDSECHILIDDIKIDKNIIEDIKQRGKLSKLSTIIITQNSTNIDFCPIIHIPKATIEDMMHIAGRTDHVAKELALLCDGNIRNFLNALEFKTLPDNFTEPKELVYELFCKQHKNKNPWDVVSKCVSDHGYMWSIVHENILDSPLWDYTMSECMSLADIYDAALFAGNWDLMNYFLIESMVRPALQIDNTLDRSSMRSGSCWTKFNNYKMRHKKVQKMQLDIDRIHTIKELCRMKSDDHLDILKHYSIGRQELDVINHLAITRKIKAKDLNALKKQITVDTK